MEWYQWLLAVILAVILTAYFPWRKVLPPWLRVRWTRTAVTNAAPAAASQGQTTVAAPATGGWLSGTGGWIGRNWLALVMVAFFFLVVGPCCYEVVSIPRKIAQDGREWEEALYEIARKASSPAEKQQELPKEEPDAPSPLSRVEMVDWWMKHGRPRPADGWKETGTEIDFHANGELGLVPVINTTFWEGYQLKIRPLYGLEVLSVLFSDNVDLVDSSSGDLDKKVLASLNTANFTNRLHETQIARDTGLVWVRTDRTVKKMPGDKIGFTVAIKEPRDNEPLVRRKQGSVRFAYQREFRPMAGSDQGLTARCCTLPFQMIGQATGTAVPVSVDFDIDVTLARLPNPGETTVTETRPNAQDLDKRLVILELVDDGGTVVYEWHINEWHVRLSAEKDIRPHLGDRQTYPRAELRFRCGMPVGIHVAIQINGTRQ